MNWGQHIGETELKGKKCPEQKRGEGKVPGQCGREHVAQPEWRQRPGDRVLAGPMLGGYAVATLGLACRTESLDSEPACWGHSVFFHSYCAPPVQGPPICKMRGGNDTNTRKAFTNKPCRTESELSGT